MWTALEGEGLKLAKLRTASLSIEDSTALFGSRCVSFTPALADKRQLFVASHVLAPHALSFNRIGLIVCRCGCAVISDFANIVITALELVGPNVNDAWARVSSGASLKRSVGPAF